MQVDASFVQPGMEVVGADFNRVGRVLEVQVGYLRVDRQHPLRHHELYVPQAEITKVSEADQLVVLRVSSADVDDCGWEHPPRDTAAAASGVTAADSTGPSPVKAATAASDTAEPRIRELLRPAVDSVMADEPVLLVQRRMEGEALRSLIVVEGNQPVGIVSWRAIMHLTDTAADQLVRDVMQRDVPVLTEAMTLSDARAALAARSGTIDIDRLPVVGDAGQLVGEVTRAELVPPTQPTGDEPAVRSGMDVSGAGGRKLGTVTDIVRDPTGQFRTFVVAHGLLGRKHKELPASVIDHIDGDMVVLTIDAPEFKLLANREDVS